MALAGLRWREENTVIASVTEAVERLQWRRGVEDA